MVWHKLVNCSFLSISLALGLSSCQAQEANLENSGAADKWLKEKQVNEVVVNMSLETMFTDQQVRNLAGAAGDGDLKLVGELVAKGVDVNSRGAKKVTPLFWAMKNISGYEQLLEYGADPNLVFGDSSVMHWAARHEDIRFLQMALDHGGNPNLIAGKFDETPLFKTIGVEGDSNRKAMLLLLESGADINAKTGGDKVLGMSMGRQTPVMAAADLVRFDIVLELLEMGAEYLSEDDNGRDLMDRVVSVKGRFASGSEQERNLNEVTDFLSAHGEIVPK